MNKELFSMALPDSLAQALDAQLKQINAWRAEDSKKPLDQKQLVELILWQGVEMLHHCPDPAIDFEPEDK